MNQKRPMQTDSQSLGDIGATTVQLILQKFKWTADIIKSDFGEDIDCNIFIDNIRTNYHFRCQVKSSTKDSKYIRKLKNGDFSISIEATHLRAWQTSYFPVFLIIYEEETDKCYWTMPVEQIFQSPRKLNAKAPTINISKNNIFDDTTKDNILNTTKNFYSKFLRVDESAIECNVVPVLMPDYKVIPIFDCYDFIHSKSDLQIDLNYNLIENLPSWMMVLRRIDPSSIHTFLKISSTVKVELEEFIKKLKQKLLLFDYSTKNNKWISFIISPIKISSRKSNWENELTSWLSFSKINNHIVDDFNYTFESPNNFLRQITRRSMSWDSSYFVDPTQDIAIRFLGANKITPAILNINQIHLNNIKGQYLLWECKKEDIETLHNKISTLELQIQILENTNEKCLVAIAMAMFDPTIGMYTQARDWESYENGNAKNILEKNNMIQALPGNEYKGKTPVLLKELLKPYGESNYTMAQVNINSYIWGFPLMQNQREIYISRFQEIAQDKAEKLKLKIKKYKHNFQIELILVDDTFRNSIYELLIGFIPNLEKSSKDAYLDKESEILKIFDDILPTKTYSDTTFKNSFDILHVAGQIEFEKHTK
ncbi:DUF4365 domain-containing protein [Sulfurospirillum cavolei]|uniref:DUF4365 domain-containing protein n=1 Tax=Sulfurospirillum cavolei TaxID=366522 RepID=UPI000764A30B|nr:DUF4365 domain-containing protein [Sulfurospirillum cavolei]